MFQSITDNSFDTIEVDGDAVAAVGGLAEDPTANVLGIIEVVTYRSCKRTACYSKKLSDTFQCPACDTNYTEQTADHGVTAQLCLQDETSVEILDYRVFKNILVQLVTAARPGEILSHSADLLADQVMARLPCVIKYKANNRKVITQLTIV